jgi:hypothetical protein
MIYFIIVWCLAVTVSYCVMTICKLGKIERDLSQLNLKIKKMNNDA